MNASNSERLKIDDHGLPAFQLHLDWTKGGEYAALKKVLSSYIQGFRNANLNPIFVWDVRLTHCELLQLEWRTFLLVCSATLADLHYALLFEQ